MHTCTRYNTIICSHADYSEARQKLVRDQLTRVILRLLAENSNLHYYQGLHDVVLTILLVAGEDVSYAIMRVLVNHHIRCGCYQLCTMEPI